MQAAERYVRLFRAMTAALPGPAIPATRQIPRWLLTRPGNLGEDEQAQLGDIQERCPHPEHPDRPRAQLRQGDGPPPGEQEPQAWLTRVEAGDLPELRSFANGIRRVQQAVTAGPPLTMPVNRCPVWVRCLRPVRLWCSGSPLPPAAWLLQ